MNKRIGLDYGQDWIRGECDSISHRPLWGCCPSHHYTFTSTIMGATGTADHLTLLRLFYRHRSTFRVTAIMHQCLWCMMGKPFVTVSGDAVYPNFFLLMNFILSFLSLQSRVSPLHFRLPVITTPLPTLRHTAPLLPLEVASIQAALRGMATPVTQAILATINHVRR